MMARSRRYGRRGTKPVKTGAAIAAAAVVGGGAIAVVALATGGHSAASAANAAYSNRSGHSSGYNEGNLLSSVLRDFGSSRSTAYSDMASMTSARDYSQTSHHGSTLDIQRGIVVLATNQFIILQSANGSLHLWEVSGNTKFENASTSTAATAAMTASTTATTAAMESGDMIPATTLMAGSPTTAASMLTPTSASQTVTVDVAGTDLTVTITVSRSTATVSQTATTTPDTTPTSDPTTSTQSATEATDGVARGDLATIAGTRSDHVLQAELVLFDPLTTADVGGSASTGESGAHPAATATTTPAVTATTDPFLDPSDVATADPTHW
jgi:trimeric autotransporter adhesin